jgi:1,4-alpha-glucan branching enzyme
MTARDAIEKIVHSSHQDPFDVLGAHLVKVGGKEAVVVRAFLPQARDVSVLEVAANLEYPMKQVHSDGFFEAVVKTRTDVFSYLLKMTDHNGAVSVFSDPYSFLPVLSDYDLYLMTEGTHYRNYERLGAHVMTIGGEKGLFFAVWAPNALRVSVVGDFNAWDGRRHPMRLRGSTGVWELFLPGLGTGDIYKFEVKSRHKGYLAEKADPYAFYSELRPKSASVAWDINTYQWNDRAWMEDRATRNWLEVPLSIYELHFASWRRVPPEGNRWFTYREMADALIPYVKRLGYTHVELMPMTEHALDESWGYQTMGYFAATSRFGTPDDLMYFVDRCHQEGVGVFMDWVPAHFPKDAHGLAYFDGTALYEHEDPRKGEHRDWGTLIFNFGRTEVANFLLSSALFWLDKYHIDGLRVDAVASMLYLDYSRPAWEHVTNQHGGNENLEAVAFLKRFNEIVHGLYPGVLTIAEESTAWPMVSRPTYLGGLGFSLKWNMGWMHDTLRYFSLDSVHRKYHQNSLTFVLLYAFTENFVLPLSHDEVVYGKRSMADKMPGDLWQKFANLRALYTFMYGQPGKKLLFMGGEIGQWSEWNSDQSLEWHLLDHEPHRALQRFVGDLNHLLQREPAMYEVDFSHEGFEWIDFGDYQNSVFSFIRKAKDKNDFLVFVFNFTPVPRYNYRVGVPRPGSYQEILNSDSERYWGGNLGNCGVAEAEPIWWHGRPWSLDLTLPPLSGLVFKPT